MTQIDLPRKYQRRRRNRWLILLALEAAGMIVLGVLAMHLWIGR